MYEDATFLSLQIYHTHSPATTIINTRNHMPSDVLYTHLNALICQNKNGSGGPITYQFIILYSISSENTVYQNFSNIFYVFLCIELR